MDFGLLIARLVIGLGFAAHGSRNLFGWFHGAGLNARAAYLEEVGFRPGWLYATGAGLAEFGGGLLVALGLLGPLGPALVIAVSLVAILTVHAGNGFFAERAGAELPLLYASGAMLLAMAGPGNDSVDRALGLQWLSSPVGGWAAIAMAVSVALLRVALRQERHPEKHIPAHH